MNHVPKVDDLERARRVTWGELAGLEPRLNELLWQARAAAAGCRCRQDAHRAFAPIRDAVAELIGFLGRHRDHPVLGSVGAYEVAYWRLHHAVWELLPRRDQDEEARLKGPLSSRLPAALALRELAVVPLSPGPAGRHG